MPTLSSTFDIEVEIWVVDPTVPVLYHGTIIEVVMSEYASNNGDVVDTVAYNILLDNDAGTLKSTEDYMATLQADAITILAGLIDNNVC